MNKKIISLCIILFIMIMCTTVNANDVSTTDAITNITDNNIKDNTSLTNTVGVEVQANVQTTTSHDNITNNEINTKLETNNEKQDVQTNAQKDLIVKHNSSTVKTDTEQIQKLTGLNITGIITTAYDKTNKIYAPDEDEGFVAAGAKITLYDESTGKRIGTTLSDSDGYYQFLNLSEGYYSMELEYGTYAKGEEAIHLLDSLEFNYIFVPDLVIITFSGDASGSGQSEKINYLSLMSDRFLFLESYELNSSYDRSGQWMVEGANFILVDMYSVGNGFGINDDIIAKSTASRNNHIAYVFGLFDESLLKGPLGNWGFLQNNPHDVQNTIVGSYWQTLSISDSPIIKRNMENLFSYIKYILGETKVDPTTVEGGQPLLLSNSWGLYYPGYENDVKTPSPDTIMNWIYSNPGYNHDHSGSLNWMTDDYSKWNLENNNPTKIFRDFEDWYDTNKKEYDSPFIVISTYYRGGSVVDALIKEYEKQGRAVFSIYKTTSEQPDMTALLEIAGNKSVVHRGVSAVSYMYWWTTGYADRGGNYTINAYKNLNVSLINALKDISYFSYESQ